MDDELEYRGVDESTFDRYVRYAFRPTAGPVEGESVAEGETTAEGASTGAESVDGASAGDGNDDATPAEDGADADASEVERAERGLYRPNREEPVTVAGYHDFRARIRGRYHRLGGVTLVATPPEHRRQGHGRELMRRMLLEFRDEGIDHSALWPFDRSFYRRLGWGTGSRYRRIEAPPDELRAAGADRTGEFRPATAEEWERLVPVHEAHGAGRGLHVDRTEAWWRRRIFEGWGEDPYVYRWEDDGGETRAYLTYVIDDGDDGTELRVYEASWADSLARRQLLRFLGDHDSQVETVKFTAPLDPEFPTLETVEDPSSVTVEVEVGHMVRLTDVAAGLSALSYPEGVDDELRVAVEDPLVDANDGVFALPVADGRAECTRVEDGDPDVSLGVGRLSQLAVGYRDASAMVAAGHLDAPPGTVDRLDALFPTDPVWLREGF